MQSFAITKTEIEPFRTRSHTSSRVKSVPEACQGHQGRWAQGPSRLNDALGQLEVLKPAAALAERLDIPPVRGAAVNCELPKVATLRQLLSEAQEPGKPSNLTKLAVYLMALSLKISDDLRRLNHPPKFIVIKLNI